MEKFVRTVEEGVRMKEVHMKIVVISPRMQAVHGKNTGVRRVNAHGHVKIVEIGVLMLEVS